jgi:amino acid transporter
MLFAFARDGFLPSALAAVHPRFRTPHWAIVAQTALVAALAITGSFERLAIIANASVLLVYVACCLAADRLRRLDVRAGGLPFRVPAAAFVPWLALGAIAWLLKSLKLSEWLAVLIALLVAVPLYWWARARGEPERRLSGEP